MGNIITKPIPATQNLPLMDLLGLNQPVVRKDARETSKAAVKHLSYDSFRAQILYTLYLNKQGLTTVELGDIMGFPRDYISPHIKALESLGMLIRDGSTRKNIKTNRQTECEICKISQRYLDSSLKRQTGENWEMIQRKTLVDKLKRTHSQILMLKLTYRETLEEILEKVGIILHKIYPQNCEADKFGSQFCFDSKSAINVCNQCGEVMK